MIHGVEIRFLAPGACSIELLSDRSYREDEDFEIYLNGTCMGSYRKHVLSFFDLESGASYQGEVHTAQGAVHRFSFTVPCPTYVLDVRDFGALGDGQAHDGAAINMALYCAQPGSVVYIPKGRYRVDSILLRSAVSIYLAAGAELIQDCERRNLARIQAHPLSYDGQQRDYNSSWEGNPLDCYGSLIYGREVEDVAIYGPGVLNGSGQEAAWWEQPKEAKEGAFRPRNVQLVRCKRIALVGLTSRNSAAWNIHPLYSDDLDFIDLQIQSRIPSPNTDGIDPESCQQLRILGCHFAVGDDCIAIKSGKIYMAEWAGRPTRGVTVRNCYMEGGHAGVAIGSESAGGVSGVQVQNCLFEGTDRGLRIKTRRGRGWRSVMEDIDFSNCVMDAVQHAFVCNMYYFCDPDGHSPEVRAKEGYSLGQGTPSVRTIRVAKLEARNIRGTALFAYGLAENPIQKIRLEDSRFHFASERATEPAAMMDDFEFSGPYNRGIYVQHVRSLEVENCSFEGHYYHTEGGRTHEHQ